MPEPLTPEEPGGDIWLSIPGMIDGDPLDVEKTILSTLPDLIDEVAAYIDAAVKQLSNAERTRIVRSDKNLDALELAHAYDESDRAGSLARLSGAAKALCAAAAEMD